MASSAFAKAMDKKKNSAKLLQKAKDAENNNFEVPTIEEGSHILQIRSAKTGVTPNKGVPFVEFRWKVADSSQDYGKAWQQTFFLDNEDQERLEKTFEHFGKALKVLSGNDELDVEDFEQVDELVKEIDTDKPYVRSTVKNWEGKNGRGITVYFNELVLPEGKDIPEDAVVEESVDAQDIIPTNNDVVEKGQTVLYNGDQYEVTTSNPRYSTCTLRSVDDPAVRVPNVAWGEVEIIG